MALASPLRARVTQVPSRAAGFAQATDRGDLMGYPAHRVVRQDGAYTFHRVDLSEAHALAAAVSGRMRVTMPDGQAVDFAYDRHEEHPSGDWTWVGHAVRGTRTDDIVLTFGAQAVFGTIARPGRAPVNLIMRDGASWLVETDPARAALAASAGVRRDGSDALLPPATAAADGAQSGAPTAATLAGATASAATTVDLVLGYTPGFASYHGGVSQAITRLNFMVDVANEAYINSQVDARVRLVHTIQINYGDATDNGDALESLTGYKSGTGSIPIPAELQPLRAARDQYGADLVSLVRRFNTPENDGCGIAWLLGGGRSTLDASDAGYAYSVVSDGQDAGTDGKTYFCRQETLAHEMGHNMGLQHDRNTADGDDNVLQNNEYGAFTYSFGHKTTAGAGNFYTVMAYGDSGQTSYRVFSNPRITLCGGFACGVADSADNARALAITAPIIAGFRATKVVDTPPPPPPAPAPWRIVASADANADGRQDLFWRNENFGLEYWLMNGAAWTYGGVRSVASKYEVATVADVSGDGRADLIWRDASRTELWAWIAKLDGSYDVVFLRPYPVGWEIVGSGDLNGDRKADLIWRNPSIGVEYWYMNGASWVYGGARSVSSKYEVVGVGDFDGNGLADLVWRDTGRTEVWLWLTRAAAEPTVHFLRGYPAGWSIVGVADANADGRSDIFWHNSNVGLEYWLMSGTTWTYGGARAVASRYRVEAVADIDGDGRADVIWRDEAATELWSWIAAANGGYSITYLRSHP